MSYWSIEIETPSELSDWLSWLVAERLDVAVEIQDDETMTRGPEPDWCRLLVRTENEPDLAWVKEIQNCLIEVGCAGAPIRTKRSDDDSWKLGWKAFFKPTEVAAGVIVRPPWSEQSNAEVDVVIDPGLAFGTGTHATTQLAAQLLRSALDGSPKLRVLDQGCGSGILSFIAAKLGHQVHGVEIDPMATRNAQENIPLNHLGVDQIKFTCSDLVPAGPFDVVVANIVAPILIELSQALSSASQTMIILSGMLTDQEPNVLKAFPDWVVHKRITSGEWVGVILQKAEAS